MPDYIDTMASMLLELGESTPEVVEILQDGAAWIVTLEDDLPVLLERDWAGTLSLTVDLGQPPERQRQAVCEAMMNYNSLIQATGGMALAVAEPGGEFQQCCLMPAEPMNVDMLRSIVLEFAERARLWKQVVALGADPALLPAAAAEFVMTGAMRA